MTDDHWKILETAFATASSLSGASRARFVAEFCAVHPGLEDQLRELLTADGDDDEFLQSPIATSVEALADATADPWEKRQVGPWTIVRRIADGGMGAVFLAERSDQHYKQTVALKVMSAQLLTRNAIARFRDERQILASLNHPNIARLLDGGSTDEKLPYLVMEYVDGLPIDRYCDELKLDVRSRLQLFAKVCNAVDYAHRNLVVHRDLKPNNILVGEDGEPKLLDFGIAKLLERNSLDQTMAMTREGARLMTPEYASPEQVRGELPTTATDVYALGVLLFRLLTGQSPYGSPLRSAREIEHAIIKSNPRKPSTVITSPATDSKTSTVITAEEAGRSRATSPARLQRQLHGDLDNIVLKTLQKDPRRRYETATRLAEDIQRYLDYRPVHARPDAWTYLFGKFLRRHRVGVAVTLAFFTVLIVSGVQVVNQRDKAETQAATAERVSGFLVSMLQSSDPYARSDAVTAREILDRGAKQINAELAEEPLVGARLKVTMAKAYSSLGMQDTAASLSRSALDSLDALPDADLDRAAALVTLADIEYRRQDYSRSKSLLDAALALYVKLELADSPQAMLGQISASRTLLRLDASDEAVAAAQRAVNTLTRVRGGDHPQTIAAVANLSAIYNDLGNYDRARALAEAVVEWLETAYGEADILLAEPLHSLGRITWHQGNYRAANGIYLRELGILEAALGTNHPSLYGVLVSLASNQRKLGYAKTAKAYYERAIQVLEDAEFPPKGKLADTYGSLGTLIMDEGFLDEAEPLIRRALVLNQQVYGEGNAQNSFRLLHMGILHRKRGEYDEARNFLGQAVNATLSRYPETHRDVQIMRLHLGVAELQAGAPDEARRLLEGVLTTLQVHHGVDHPLVGQTMIELSGVEIEVGNNEAADRLLTAALDIYRAHRDNVHPDIELILRWRAITHQNMNMPAAAARFEAEADALQARRQMLTAEEAQTSQQPSF